MGEGGNGLPGAYAALKDTFEAFRAQSRRLHNLQEFYKWSLLGGVTGAIGGLAAMLFNWTLDSTASVFANVGSSAAGPVLLVGLPALGGLLVGVIRTTWAPEAFRFSSATDSMIDAVHRRDGRMPANSALLTLVTSAITLGTGGSAGREGPAIHMGAGIGELTRRLLTRLRVTERLGIEFGRQEARMLVLCGAAAGLGAVFRAPLGAALFASSVLFVHGMDHEIVLPSLVSSVTGYLVISLQYGFEPLFRAPVTWSFNLADLALVILIGLLASIAGVLYIRVFHGVFAFFRRLSLPDWMKPAIGGLGVGLLALVAPRVWGMGYETIQDAIDYRVAAGALVVVLFAKVVATSLTIGSGGAGGDMAPALFIGAALGGLVGIAAQAVFPDATLHPSLYVVAGMGALYSSVGKVPLATAVLLCESTRNFTMIIPLLVANTTGALAASRHTIYESQHADASIEKADVLRRVPVGDVAKPLVVTAPEKLSVFDLLRLIGETGHHGFPVLDDEGKLSGVVSWSDAKRVPYEERRDTTVGQICTRDVATMLPTDSSRRALDTLDSMGIGRIVVVDPDDAKRVVGVVTTEDIVRAYAAELRID